MNQKLSPWNNFVKKDSAWATRPFRPAIPQLPLGVAASQGVQTWHPTYKMQVPVPT